MKLNSSARFNIITVTKHRIRWEDDLEQYVAKYLEGGGNLYKSPNIVWVIKCWLRWAENVARIGTTRNE
jgi:hypothetical protein